MPHKHKRTRDNDEDFDLPPSQRARPLSTDKRKNETTPGSQPSKKKQKNRKSDNDAPRAFRRLMAVSQGKKMRSGLDDGRTDAKSTPNKTASIEAPQIRPGEDLRSFNARVDASMPVSGLAHKTKVKDGKDEQGFKVYKTRKERKMHKLYDQWRAEERKIQERKEDEAEEAAERELDNDAEGITTFSTTGNFGDASGGGDGSAGGKKSRKKRAGEDDDPWAALKKRRAEAKTGLHDVNLAPPQLTKKTTGLLKVNGAAVGVENVPKASGSLRKREALQATRDEVVEAYRKIREHEQAKIDAKKVAR